mmetsp:Transcript_5582/g.7774  ORF Transcript_5582/g.7774 Transcript_5582/m.7774 type:complete len:171 (-) Transcript_5582:190-702(-)
MTGLRPIRYRTELMKKECGTLAANGGQRSSTIQLRPLPKEASELSTEEEWMAEIRLARALYEEERQRSMILEIQKSEITAKQWKAHIANLLEPLETEMKQLARQSKEEVDDINIAREQHQTKDVGPVLTKLNAKYHELVHKKFQLQLASSKLEGEIRSREEPDVPVKSDD